MPIRLLRRAKGNREEAGLSTEVTPIVVNGVMYLPGGNRVFALEADTGKELWTFTAPGAVGNRAVGYWPGDQNNPPRVLFTTGRNMMARNANTGKVVCQGRNGKEYVAILATDTVNVFALP